MLSIDRQCISSERVIEKITKNNFYQIKINTTSLLFLLL